VFGAVKVEVVLEVDEDELVEDILPLVKEELVVDEDELVEDVLLVDDSELPIPLA
jgi:hypothetical protein